MNKKKVLGLDLGVSSIGWAIVELDEKNINNKILGLGSRVIPLSPDEKDQFEKGNAQTKNRDRTQQRTARKTNFRYKLRREYLATILKQNSMMPTADLYALNSLELYGIRAKAVTEKIELKELGRLFLLLNQKRGYRGSMKEKVVDEKKQGDYLKSIKEREDKLNGRTIGQFFYDALQQNEKFEIKKNIFYRATYIHEFDAIWNEQVKHHSSVLTNELREKIRNEIIYFQRPLKSQKHLVGGCTFETRTYFKGKEKKVEPIKVASLSSPLFQVSKVWQTINNIEIKGIKDKIVVHLEPEQKQTLFNYISLREKTSWADILKQVGLNKDEYRTNVRKDITGNFTLIALRKKLEEAKLDKHEIEELTSYDPLLQTNEHDAQPFYKLWHIIYSIEQQDEAVNAITKKFNFISKEQATIITTMPLKDGFCSLSSKALKKILPHLQNGLQYDKACLEAGYNHSNSITKEENELRKLLPIIALQNIQRGTLRNPAVERILNQLINVVKDIYATYGEPNEIRIELARELKQNAEERNKAFKRNNDREKDRKSIIDELIKHSYFQGKRISNRDIEKYQLWREFDGRSPYNPSKEISLSELFSTQYEIEHIIPRSLFFDDSFNNKCIAHVTDNKEKDNNTAYDFMKVNRASKFDDYCNFIQDFYKRKIGISKTKFDRLMTSKDEIPQDFIDRQLRETQYITKEAKKILSTVCRNVWITGGTVTDYVRRIWGYDKVIESLHFDKYKAFGLTETITIQQDHQDKTFEQIKDWSKRLDHRHHAIDALAIACTTQGIIQKINTLATQKTRNEMFEALQNEKQFEEKRLMDKYVKKFQPFTTAQVAEQAAQILISFRVGKKVASISKNKVGKYRIGKKQWIPRTALHEESVYGKIKQYEKIEVKKLSPETVELIVDENKKEIIKSHLIKYNDDYKKAFTAKALKELIYKNKPLEKITIYKDEFVKKYDLNDSFKEKDCEFILDKRTKKAVLERLKQYNGDSKKAFAELHNNPIWIDEEKGLFVKSVRCKTGLSDLKDANRGFVKPGNNHHIAIYENEKGELKGECITMWEAFERIQQGVSVIAGTHPDYGTLKISLQQNEMFVFDLPKEEINDAIKASNKKIISQHLYRVQKLSIKSNGSIDLWFRKHLETQLDDSNTSKEMKRFINIQSIGKLSGIKVNVDRLGNIKI